jgi:hypothetical protein
MLAYAASPAAAQNAPPTYEGDPSVYKVIFEDQNYRVIEAVRKAGVRDKPHSHPVPSIVYNLTDCPTKLYDADGKFVREGIAKAGAASGVPATTGHTAENSGTTECRQIFVERK